MANCPRCCGGDEPAAVVRCGDAAQKPICRDAAVLNTPLAALSPIGHAHLPEVMAVQARAYGAQFLEAPEVLGSKLQAPGGTCWGAFAARPPWAPGASRSTARAVNACPKALGLCAYAIAHVVAPNAPLVLNKVLTAAQAPPAPDSWLYVHDIAVDPTWAGAGLAARLLAEVLGAGRSLGLRRAMLVAVQGADVYWARHGFAPQVPPMPVQGFGDGAVWMVRDL